MNTYEKHLKHMDVEVSNKGIDERTNKILLAKERIPLKYFWRCSLCKICFPAFTQPAALDGYTDKTRKLIVTHIEAFHKISFDEWEKELPLKEYISKILK